MSENNNIWENKDNFYATDGRYTLIKLTEADKDNYYRLLEQTNTIPGFYDQPGNYEIMWKVAMDLKDPAPYIVTPVSKVKKQRTISIKSINTETTWQIEDSVFKSSLCQKEATPCL